MLSLVTTFEKNDGKNHRWTIKDIDGNRTAAEIQADLEEIAELQIFEKDGVLLKKVVKAKIVETIETDLFDLSKTAVEEAEVSEKKPEKTDAAETNTKQMPKNVPTLKEESAQDLVAPDPDKTEKPNPVKTNKSSMGKLVNTGKIPEAPYAVLDKKHAMNKLGIEVPKGIDISKMSQEEFSTFLTTLLPEGMVFKDGKFVEKPKDKNGPRGKPEKKPGKTTGSRPKMTKKQLKKLMKQQERDREH